MPFFRTHMGLLLIAMLCSVVVYHDSAARAETADDNPTNAPSLRASLLYGDVGLAVRTQAVPGRRSVPLALGLSAAVPGLGQAYNRQWIKAGISVAAEALLLAGYIKWRNDGLDGERAFKAQAHAEWSPTQYALWINDYTDFLEAEHGGSFTFSPIDPPQGIDFANPSGWSEADRAVVRSFFAQIRAAETQLFHPETGATFSHRLPDHGDQQYYELIGKYFQFAPGWVDYPEWINEDGFTEAIDPERTGTGGTKPNVSPTFFQYARDHAESQDVLRRASVVTSLIIVNHVISAIDAAVFSKLHNNRLEARMEIAFDDSGVAAPRARLNITL